MMNIVSMLLLPAVTALSRECEVKHGVWVPESGDCFALVIQQLVTNRQKLKELNPDWNIDDIWSNIPYRVPFEKPIYGASWSNDCPPELQLPADREQTRNLLCEVSESTTTPASASNTILSLSSASSQPATDSSERAKSSTSSGIDKKPTESSFVSLKESGSVVSASHSTTNNKPTTQSSSPTLSTTDSTEKRTTELHDGTVAPSQSNSFTKVTEHDEPPVSTPKSSQKLNTHTSRNSDELGSLMSEAIEVITTLPSTCLTKTHHNTESIHESYTSEHLFTETKSVSESSETSSTEDRSATSQQSTALPTTYADTTFSTSARDTPSQIASKSSTDTTTKAATVSNEATNTQSPSHSLTTKPESTLIKKTSSISSTITTASSGQTDLPEAKCKSESELPGHAPVPEQAVRLSARSWCKKNADGYLSHGDSCVSSTVNKFGVGFKYSICRLEDCAGEKQDMNKPLGDDGPSCADIMLENNWRKCKYTCSYLKLQLTIKGNNGGVGGKASGVGCYSYELVAGVGY